MPRTLVLAWHSRYESEPERMLGWKARNQLRRRLGGNTKEAGHRPGFQRDVYSRFRKSVHFGAPRQAFWPSGTALRQSQKSSLDMVSTQTKIWNPRFKDGGSRFTTLVDYVRTGVMQTCGPGICLATHHRPPTRSVTSVRPRSYSIARDPAVVLRHSASHT